MTIRQATYQWFRWWPRWDGFANCFRWELPPNVEARVFVGYDERYPSTGGDNKLTTMQRLTAAPLHGFVHRRFE